MTFSERMKKKREFLGLSQSELAEQVGVHENTIWNYENDNTKPNCDVYVEICKLLMIDTNNR